MDRHLARGPAELLREERELVHLFGGFSLEIAGGVLVTNERVPVPRFNFVHEVEVGPGRIAGFFERALDHYFQRALRPEFRLPEPVPPHLAGPLERLGFLPRPEPRVLLLAPGPTGPSPALDDRYEVRAAHEDEVDRYVEMLAATREREELYRCLEVAIAHPNPPEELHPLLALDGEGPAASALVHRFRESVGIHGIATQPGRRGQGAASALALGAVRRTRERMGPGPTIGLWAEEERIRRRLLALGFEEAYRERPYVLPASAELYLPPVPPSDGPRWRPPRPGAGGPRPPPTRAGSG